MTAAPFVALWVSLMNLSPVAFNIAMMVLIPLAITIIKYVVDVLLFHYHHTASTDAKAQLPPKFPSFLPFLGGIFQLALSHKALTEQVS